MGATMLKTVEISRAEKTKGIAVGLIGLGVVASRYPMQSNVSAIGITSAADILIGGFILGSTMRSKSNNIITI